jgi:NADH-quinone oxidoreductase subunit G
VPTIYVENKPYEVPEGQNLLHACLSLGFDIPYFCWHPAMHSVGACRMCAVKQFKDEHDTEGRIVMSCMTLAKEGTRISIQDPEAVKFRKAVIEWLMLNHPHDCPICDEGGECHLQDMTLMVGHVYRRYRFKKRTYRNQYLGPFIRHEMNRCIQCYRCVRFYLEYAGGRDLDVFGWHDQVYFGRHQDGVLQSKFSGNLVEVCPTGVFTDKPFARHYTRKWDLQTAPSVCVHCGLGCNTIPGERYGLLRRIRNRFNADVNGYFLCDRGRFGYEFVNDQRRIKRPLVRTPEERFEPLSPELLVPELRDLIETSDLVIGIGSPRASLESNYALRTLVGPEQFYSGICRTQSELISRVIEILNTGPVGAASLQDVSSADAVLVLGEDVSNVAPLLELALRRSILRKPSAIAKKLHIEPWNDAAVREALQTEKGPLFIATTGATDLDEVATYAYRSAPDDIARLGLAVANKLDPDAPEVVGLSEDIGSLAQTIADALKDAERPLVISGTSSGSRAVIESAVQVAYALHPINNKTQICFTVPFCNSMGLGLIGGKPLDTATERLSRSPAAVAIIIENDLYRHLSVAQADKLLNAANTVIAIDLLPTPTTAKAHIVLPAAAFAESNGTLVSNEGRAQRFFQVFKPEPDVRESWRWLAEMMPATGRSDLPLWRTFDEIVADVARSAEIFRPIESLCPRADFRIAGGAIARQPHRYSGRTAMHANIDVREPRTLQDKDTPLSFSMEGYEGPPPSVLITHFWAPHWNSVQSVNKFQTDVGGPLRDGQVGKRLIEPKPKARPGYSTEIPAAFKPRKGYLLVVPAYHVFGSDELSVLSPSVAELAVKPYVAVNPADARTLPMEDNGRLEVVFSGISHYLPVRLSSKVSPGLAGVPMGLKGLQWDGLPFWFKFTRS